MEDANCRTVLVVQTDVMLASEDCGKLMMSEMRSQTSISSFVFCFFNYPFIYFGYYVGVYGVLLLFPQ